MPKPFDATMRELFELEPAAWLEFLGIPVPDPALVDVVDSNLSTITADADKLVRLGGPEPLVVHPEFLSGREVGYPAQVHWYNSLASRKLGAPVWSALILLRPAADGPELTGEYQREVPGLGRNLWFRHDVVRVWKLPPDRLLAAGLPILPLAPVSEVPPERLPEVLTAVAERFRDEAAPELTKTLWTATTILMGLRYPRERVGEMIEGVANMVLGIRGIEDSWVYQDIFTKGEARGRAEGELDEARRILLRQGAKKLGQPDPQVLGRIAGLGDIDRLNVLLDRILDASSWDELLTSAES